MPFHVPEAAVDPMVAALVGAIDVDGGPNREQTILLRTIAEHVWSRPDLDPTAVTPLGPDEAAAAPPDGGAILTLALFLLGFLWAALGGGATALVAEIDRERLRHGGDQRRHGTDGVLAGKACDLGEDGDDQERAHQERGASLEGLGEEPVPAELTDGKLDLVTLMFNYHDLGFLKIDRDAMNKSVFKALKSGGQYVIADHSGRPGTGISESGTLHRIEEAFLRKEVEAAGFKLLEEGFFLRNPNDPRDKNTPDPPQPKDEFVLKFIKP